MAETVTTQHHVCFWKNWEKVPHSAQKGTETLTVLCLTETSLEV